MTATFAEIMGACIATATLIEEFRAKTVHLPLVLVNLQCDDEQVAIALGPGNAMILADSDGKAAITISGPREGWKSVLSGEHALVRETNVYLGRLKVTADPVISSWTMPALAVLFRPQEGSSS